MQQATFIPWLKRNGTVVAIEKGFFDYGQLNVSSWSGIVQVTAGSGHTVGLKADGTIVAVGRNSNGQCNVSSWNLKEPTITTTTVQPTTSRTVQPTTTVPVTVIELSSFIAIPSFHKVMLRWTTESENDNVGYNLYRSESENGEYKKINDFLITAQGSSTEGAFYDFIDNTVQNRKTYYYKLEDIDLNGTSTMHGPVSATPRRIYGIFGK